MNRIIFFATAMNAFLFVGCGKAAAPDAARAEDKDASEAVWLTDLDDAKLRSAENDQPILVNFTGSDWCAPCMQLKKDVFGTEEFLEYASENLVLLEVDFPRQASQSEKLKRQNEELSKAFNIEGFPTLVLLNPDGKETARTVGYMPGGPKRFLEWIEGAQAE